MDRNLEGLIKFDGVNWTIYNRNNSALPDNNVMSLAIDGKGNKWIRQRWFSQI